MLLTFLHIILSLFSAPDDLSVSDDMEKGVINSIKIEGVKGEEDYKLSDKKWDNKWDLTNSTAAGSYIVSFDGDKGKVEGKRDLTGVAKDNKVLMMIPPRRICRSAPSDMSLPLRQAFRRICNPPSRNVPTCSCLGDLKSPSCEVEPF